VPPDRGAPAPTGLILLALCAAQFMVIVDETVVNVALPAIGRDLGFSQRALSWVSNGYLIAFGGFLLVGGRAADLLGRGRTFSASLLGFGLASLACGLAPSGPLLVGARAVQGTAAAVLSPSALATLLATFHGPAERTRALGAWAALAGLGATTGLVLGGTLVDLLSWRWVFLINVPSSLAVLAAFRSLAPAAGEGHPRPAPGLGGALLVTGALVLVAFSVVGTPEHGWGAPRTLAGILAGGLLAVAFVVRERAAAEPLVPKALLRIRRIVLGNVLAFVMAGGLFAMFYITTLYMQTVLGYSALRTGLSYLPFSAAVGAASAAATAWLKRGSPRPLLVAGPLVAAAGLRLMSGLGVGSPYAARLLPALVIAGIGLGLALVPLAAVVTAGVESRDTGVASGLLTTSQQVGAVLGIAVLAAVAGRPVAATGEGPPPAEALVAGYRDALGLEAVVLLCAVALALAIPRAAGRISRQVHDSMQHTERGATT